MNQGLLWISAYLGGLLGPEGLEFNFWPHKSDRIYNYLGDLAVIREQWLENEGWKKALKLAGL